MARTIIIRRGEWFSFIPTPVAGGVNTAILPPLSPKRQLPQLAQEFAWAPPVQAAVLPPLGWDTPAATPTVRKQQIGLFASPDVLQPITSAASLAGWDSPVSRPIRSSARNTTQIQESLVILPTASASVSAAWDSALAPLARRTSQAASDAPIVAATVLAPVPSGWDTQSQTAIRRRPNLIALPEFAFQPPTVTVMATTWGWEAAAQDARLRRTVPPTPLEFSWQPITSVPPVVSDTCVQFVQPTMTGTRFAESQMC